MPDQTITPRVTVITPTYNRESLLMETVESVRKQTFSSYEHIIIDDGSTDRTREMIRSLDDSRIRYYWHENCGEAASTNRGWSLARGDYVAVVSSDDPVEPDWLDKAVHFMESNPDVVVGYPEWRIIDENSNHVQNAITFEYSLKAMVSWLYTLPGPGSLIRRRALPDVVRLRNPEYRFVSDLESWLRLGLRGPFARIPGMLATWRRHSTSITVADRSEARAREMIRLARDFFRRPDIPEELLSLKKYSFSRAYWLAAWVVSETSPLKSALYLRTSYRLAPDNPPDMPRELSRFPQPTWEKIQALADVEKSRRIPTT